MKIKIILITALGLLGVPDSTLAECKQLEPIVLVHGGAGKVSESKVPLKLKGVKLAARAGYKTLVVNNGSVLDAVEIAVRSMELDENFNAGYGSVLTWDGNVEADAAIMNGKDLSAGCVSIVEDILHPISLARRVMDRTKHSFIAGIGVMNFAKEQQIEILPHGALVTEAAKKALEDYKKSINRTTTKTTTTSSHKTGSSGDFQFGEPGTVGAVAIDSLGNIAVATSTGGIIGKLTGRIGDTPILGAGTYADNRLGGVSATGHGESIMRFNVAQKILQLIEYKGLSAQDATVKVLDEMTQELQGTGGAITIDAKGNVGIYFTSDMMAWAYQKGKETYSGIYKKDPLMNKKLRL